MIKTTVINEVIILLNKTDMDGNPLDNVIQLNIVDKIDDPDDDLLPISRARTEYINKYTDGELTDITMHDELVQTICNAVWAD